MLFPLLKNNTSLGTALLYSVAVHLALLAMSSSNYFSSHHDHKKNDVQTYHLKVEIQPKPLMRQSAKNNDSQLTQTDEKPAQRSEVNNTEPGINTVKKSSSDKTKPERSKALPKTIEPPPPLLTAEIKAFKGTDKIAMRQSNPQQPEWAAIQPSDKALSKPAKQIINQLPPILKAPPPLYPEEARWEGRRGRVTLQFHISARGLPRDIQIAKTSGHPDLDRAAMLTLKRWRFETSKLSKPIIWHTYSFRFELD